ncbi:hypothetical protein CN386_23105 [Bacillus cereus]|nr:hypothetical protein MLA2C4_23540 [Bacillus mobilis]PEU74101.1 hypothetical protein CN386_23105 [Bacillus cereus]PGT77625.1 hypothetical protein COD14_07125 [Bacillus cereus]PGV96843.1 hypothetical protein COD86_09500 [Bacillus cereus]
MFYSRIYLAICWAVRLPPQNLVVEKKLGGSRTARKRPIDSTNNQWRWGESTSEKRANRM